MCWLPAGQVGQVNVVTPHCPQAGQDLSERGHYQVLRVAELRGQGRGSRHGPRAGHVILTAGLVEERFPPLTVLKDEALVAVKWCPARESIQRGPTRGQPAVDIKTENKNKFLFVFLFI